MTGQLALLVPRPIPILTEGQRAELRGVREALARAVCLEGRYPAQSCYRVAVEALRGREADILAGRDNG